jgi:hypothetical protein
VLYTHIKGPDEFKRNRLSRLLAARPGDKVAVSLPGFRMGLKDEAYKEIEKDLFRLIGKRYNYRGRTFARSDVDAAKELLDLLTEVGSLERVTILDDADSRDFPVTFFFGSGSHERIMALIGEYSRQFKPEFKEETWSIIDTQNKRRYDTPSPARHATIYGQKDDWGFIEKAISGDKCYFFVCGLGDRATRGCAYLLARNWQELLDRHQDGPFAELVRFPGRLDHTHGKLVDRTNNLWGIPRGTQKWPPAPPPGLDPDDPQKGRWGGKSEAGGVKLEAVLTEVRRHLFYFDLVLSSTDEAPLGGPARFHLHPTYRPSIVTIRKVRPNRTLVLEEVDAHGTFTVGAEVKRPDSKVVSVELDLADLPDLPRRFR